MNILLPKWLSQTTFGCVVFPSITHSAELPSLNNILERKDINAWFKNIALSKS